MHVVKQGDRSSEQAPALDKQTRHLSYQHGRERLHQEKGQMADED